MKQKINLFFQNEYFKGGVFLTISSFLINIFNYLFNLLSGRFLTPKDYSEIATLFSYIYILTIPMGIITTIVIQKIGSSEDKNFQKAKTLEHFFLQKINKNIYLFLLSFLIVPFLPQITNLSPITSYFFIPLLILFLLNGFYVAIIQGLKLFFVSAAIGLFVVLIKFTGPAIGLFFNTNLLVIFSFLLTSILLSFLLCKNIFEKEYAKKDIKDFPKIEKKLLYLIKGKQIYLTAISLLGITLLSNIDVIYAKKFFTGNEAGVYAIWSLFGKIIFYLLGPILYVAFIFFTQKKYSINKKILFIGWTLFFITIGSFSYLFYSLFSKEIIIAMFGKQYLELVNYLGMAAIFGTFYSVITFINNFFIAKENPKMITLTLLMPLYFIGLIFVKNNFIYLIYLNIYFSTLVIFVFLYFLLIKKFAFKKNTYKISKNGKE